MGVNWGAEDFTKPLFWRAILAEFFGMIFFLLGVSLVALPWPNYGYILTDVNPNTTDKTLRLMPHTKNDAAALT